VRVFDYINVVALAAERLSRLSRRSWPRSPGKPVWSDLQTTCVVGAGRPEREVTLGGFLRRLVGAAAIGAAEVGGKEQPRSEAVTEWRGTQDMSRAVCAQSSREIPLMLDVDVLVVGAGSVDDAGHRRRGGRAGRVWRCPAGRLGDAQRPEKTAHRCRKAANGRRI